MAGRSEASVMMWPPTPGMSNSIRSRFGPFGLRFASSIAWRRLHVPESLLFLTVYVGAEACVGAAIATPTAATAAAATAARHTGLEGYRSKSRIRVSLDQGRDCPLDP